MATVIQTATVIKLIDLPHASILQIFPIFVNFPVFYNLPIFPIFLHEKNNKADTTNLVASHRTWRGYGELPRCCRDARL